MPARRSGVTFAGLTRISLNVVVYNEEARLEECLTDARPFVDEIVVVDQMSTDATPEIAQRLADVYVRDIHHGHAEPSRELAASRSSGDWLVILDADETMSDVLKADLRDLVEGVPDGYWIRKANFVDGVDMGTIDHYRLVRKSRVEFDPNAHGGARAVSDNVARFERIGILHEKSAAEQIYDDARYDQMALEDDEHTSSSKRNWLAHNRALRDHRAGRRRLDLEALVPAEAEQVLVLGDIRIELPGRTLVHLDVLEQVDEAEGPFDAVVVPLSGDELGAAIRRVAGLVRSGGVIVGTAPAARNRRHMEELVGGVLSEGTRPEPGPSWGATRSGLLDALCAADRKSVV